MTAAALLWREGLAALRAADVVRAEHAFTALMDQDLTAAPCALAGLAAAQRRTGAAGAALVLFEQAQEAAALLSRPDRLVLGVGEAFGQLGDALDMLLRVAPQIPATTAGTPDPLDPDGFARRLILGVAALDGSAPDADVAVAELSAALALRPDHVPCRWALFRAYCARHDYGAAVDLLTPTFLDHLDAPALLAAASRCVRAPIEDETPILAPILAAWARRRAPVVPLNPAPRDPRGRPLRVGVAQAWFAHTPYYNALIPTLTGLAATGAQVIAYQFGAYMGAPTAPLRPALSGWRDLGGVDPDQAAAAIVEDQLDVLLDLEGLSTATPLEVYRRRPAPVIASTYNGLCSLGPDLFDAVIGDAVTLSPACVQDYAERPARIAAPYYYEAFALTAPPPDDAVFAEGGPMLGAFCQPWKISASCARAWGRILAARPDARLTLRSLAFRDPLVAAAARRKLLDAGAREEQVFCDGAPLPYEEHLRRYDTIDLLLDPFPFQGPSTLFEALSRGAPAIVRQGRRWAARFGGGMLAAAGLVDDLAEDDDAYVALALKLLDAAPARRSLAARRAQREAVAASALCDVAGFGRAFETILRGMAEEAWTRSQSSAAR